MGSRTIGLVIGVSWTPDCTISTLRHLASRGRRHYPISPANATEPQKGLVLQLLEKPAFLADAGLFHEPLQIGVHALDPLGQIDNDANTCPRTLGRLFRDQRVRRWPRESTPR